MREPPRAATSGPAKVGRRDPRHELGRLGEDLAAAHLARLGCSILARNVRTRAGEIDLIAFDERQSALLFVEVKTRRVPAAGRVRPDQEPLQRLRARQRARLRRLACAWLGERTRRRPSARTIRFDAIGVILDTRDRLLRLDHIEGAW
jgi:putative endonuclease